MSNEIYIRRKTKIRIKHEGSEELSDKYIATLLKNIESFGYTLSDEVANKVKTFSQSEFKDFYEDLVKDLKKLVGDHVKYSPMYPNFPQQVMNASDLELFINAHLHYLGDWIGARIMPSYTKLNRENLKDKVKLKVIKLGDKGDFESIFSNLVERKGSLSETDKQDIEWFVSSYRDNIEKLIPDVIPSKEIIAQLGGYLIIHTNVYEKFLNKYVKTATDLLRLQVAVSGGDVSLATNTKFKSLKRCYRRLILKLLEQSTSMTEDMLRYKEQWKRAGEYLHISEYKQKFPKAVAAIDVLRNDKKFETFNSKAEFLLENRDIPALVEQLKDRPGELSRKLDNLLRISPKNNSLLLSHFEKVSEKVSTPVLLQLYAHFKHRNEEKDIRVFFPKGNVAKVKAIKNELPLIDEEVRHKVVEICEEALMEKYKKLEPLGKVYVDENLKNYIIPFALRSASKALKTIGRGSKIILSNSNVVRFFIWWKDGAERTDIDLSVLCLNSNYRFVSNIAYYNLRDYGGYHSGDITSAPEGASEFIDIDINKMLEKDVRYVIMCINSFTRQPYCDLPECFAGFMTREFPNSGEIYDPRTVQNKFDLTSDTRIAIPLIIDIQDHKVIWSDLALKSHPNTSNNVYENMSSLALMCKAILEMVKPTLYELFMLHAKSRGKLVNSKEEADTVFSLNHGITPLDTDTIVAKFL